MGKPPIPDGPTSITASWLKQALSAGVASDLPALKEVDVEVVGAGVGLMGEVLRCRLNLRRRRPLRPRLRHRKAAKLPPQEPEDEQTATALQAGIFLLHPPRTSRPHSCCGPLLRRFRGEGPPFRPSARRHARHGDRQTGSRAPPNARPRSPFAP